MKCPKCQREHTLKRAENNTVVCAACGSRFPLKTPAKPAAPAKSPNALSPDKLADGKRAAAPPVVPQTPTANVDDETLSELHSGVKHIDDAPATPQNAETTYPLRSEPTPPFNRPTVSPPPVGDVPFAARADAGTSKSSTSQTSGASAQTSSGKNRSSLFSWSGRATQREFLGAVGWYLLYSLILGIALGVLFGVLGALSQADSDTFRVVAGIGSLVVGLAGAAGGVAVTLILLAASARRLRDAGLSPYLTLLHFVGVSLPFTIFLAVYPGQTGQADAQKSEPRPQTPQNSPSNAPSASPSTAAKASNGWRRFFSWNAPAESQDLPIALGLYAATTVWLFLHLAADAYVMNEIYQEVVEEIVFDNKVKAQVVLYNFADLVSDALKLAIYLFNLSWLYALGLATIKQLRQ